MRLHICEYYWLNILSCTIFQLLHSICQIIAFDKGVPLVNALILGNLFEHCHKSYIAKNEIYWATLLLQTVFLSATKVYIVSRTISRDDYTICTMWLWLSPIVNERDIYLYFLFTRVGMQSKAYFDQCSSLLPCEQGLFIPGKMQV